MARVNFDNPADWGILSLGHLAVSNSIQIFCENSDKFVSINVPCYPENGVDPLKTMNYLENINNIEFLFLTDLYEPRNNELLIRVKGSIVADEETEAYTEGGTSISQSR